ncbi:MAG TPA: hypothetical protein VJS45_13120, partial [Acidimicrobiia bacterium]|nr:hypothetical protein [Acidimicrobiia bacterium]
RSGRTGRAGAGGTVLSLVTDDTAAAVKALQRALGFPTRTTAPDLTGPAVVVRLKAAERKPEQVKSERAKPERAKRDWAAAAGTPTPRRKPDGRPARGFGRRKAQSRRSRPA